MWWCSPPWPLCCDRSRTRGDRCRCHRPGNRPPDWSRKQILLADINTDSLAATADLMETSGYNVRTQQVDVASRESVRELAAVAADLGPVTGVVHTAGLSPVQAPVEALL